MVALTLVLSNEKMEGRILKKVNERMIKKLHGHHYNGRVVEGTTQRLRCHLIHPQQVQPSREFRHSVLAHVLA
jgi:hypothetical protein